MQRAPLAKDVTTTPRDAKETPRPYRLHGWHQDAGNLITHSRAVGGCWWKGPTHGVELGPSYRLAPRLLKANTKAGLPQPWLMLDLSVVLAARLSQFQQPVATATEL